MHEILPSDPIAIRLRRNPLRVSFLIPAIPLEKLFLQFGNSRLMVFPDPLVVFRILIFLRENPAFLDHFQRILTRLLSLLNHPAKVDRIHCEDQRTVEESRSRIPSASSIEGGIIPELCFSLLRLHRTLDPSPVNDDGLWGTHLKRQGRNHRDNFAA